MNDVTRKRIQQKHHATIRQCSMAVIDSEQIEPGLSVVPSTCHCLLETLATKLILLTLNHKL